jgi:NAD(P)-dependent dehydrogenase (short-subunit alcohol dehydrogenase family)
MGATWSQFFPPEAPLTETNLPSQSGKVFLVTGGYSGVGFELCKILYLAGGKVYLAGRSEEKARAAIHRITSESVSLSSGDIIFLSLSLDDLTTIKPAVENFSAAEDRLDVLFNNAGVSNPPNGSQSAQGHELQLATNCLGPHLLTQLLLPKLQATAKSLPPASVRVLWTSSITVDTAPSGGMDLAGLTHPKPDPQHNYTLSKLGNWFLAHELSQKVGPSGILSVTLNPGNLKTELTRHFSRVVPILVSPLLYDAKFGAYTNLWAGLSSDLTIEDGGKYIVPWGSLSINPRKDLLDAMKDRQSGGTGVSKQFVEFCNLAIAKFM